MSNAMSGTLAGFTELYDGNLSDLSNEEICEQIDAAKEFAPQLLGQLYRSILMSKIVSAIEYLKVHRNYSYRMGREFESAIDCTLGDKAV